MHKQHSYSGAENKKASQHSMHKSCTHTNMTHTNSTVCLHLGQMCWWIVSVIKKELHIVLQLTQGLSLLRWERRLTYKAVLQHCSPLIFKRPVFYLHLLNFLNVHASFLLRCPNINPCKLYMCLEVSHMTCPLVKQAKIKQSHGSNIQSKQSFVIESNT